MVSDTGLHSGDTCENSESRPGDPETGPTPPASPLQYPLSVVAQYSNTTQAITEDEKYKPQPCSNLV